MEDSKINMGGKSMGAMGNSQSHLCLTTAGDVYVKTPNRFITIFRNGKLNVDSSRLVRFITDESEMKEEGLYVITGEDGSVSVYLYAGGQKFLIATSSEGYLSYAVPQELTEENRKQAMTNIGLYFQTYEEAAAAGLQEGLVYVLDDRKLYRIVNGTLTEYVQAMTPQEDNDGNAESGIGDTLKVGVVLIDGVKGAIYAEGTLYLGTGQQIVLELSGTGIRPRRDLLLGTDITMQSDGAVREESGFQVYRDAEGLWHLETDILTVHGSEDSDGPVLRPEYIGAPDMNIIRTAGWTTDAEGNRVLELTLKYANTFRTGDTLCIYAQGGNRVTDELEDIDEEEPDSRVMTFTCEAPLREETQVTVTLEYVFDDSEPPEVHEEVRTLVLANYDSSTDPEFMEDWDTETDGTPPVYGYGEIPIPDAWGDNVYVTAVSIDSGDEDLIFTLQPSSLDDSDSDSEEEGPAVQNTIPSTLVRCTVVTEQPLTVSVETTIPDTSVSTLPYTLIAKIAQQEGTYCSLSYRHNTITSVDRVHVQEIVEDPENGEQTVDVLTGTVTGRIGALDGITVNIPKEPAEPPVEGEEPQQEYDTVNLTGSGIYSSNLVSAGGTFILDYPTYHETMKIPDTAALDAVENDNVIPNVAWVKALIRKLTGAV